MKSQKLFYTLLAFALLISCKKNVETPIACIDGPSIMERGKLVQYTWCGSGEEEVNWVTSYGETGGGAFFHPFNAPIGKFTITATGTIKDKSASKSMEVEYGISSKIICTITNECYTGNTAIVNATGYKAYLYSSLLNWKTDLENFQHNLVLDSADCQFSSSFGTIYASFTTTMAVGSKVYFSIEYRGVSSTLSNWGLLSDRLKDPINSNGFGEIVLQTSGQEQTSTNLTEIPKRILTGKWKLIQNNLNGNTVALPACNQDDYILYAADGTWKYETGPDNCGGTSLPSNGTFSKLPDCGYSSYFGMTNLSGPFGPIGTVQLVEFTFSQIKINYQSGTNTGYFTFSYTPLK